MKYEAYIYMKIEESKIPGKSTDSYQLTCKIFQNNDHCEMLMMHSYNQVMNSK